MTLIPIEKFSIDVNNKRELFTAIEQEYKIKIEGDEFKISRWRYGQGINFLIIGQIDSKSVYLTVRPSYITMAFFPVFLIAGIFGFFISKGTKDIRFSLLICGILAVLYGYIIVMTKYLSEKFKKFLSANGISNFTQ